MQVFNVHSQWSLIWIPIGLFVGWLLTRVFFCGRRLPHPVATLWTLLVLCAWGTWIGWSDATTSFASGSAQAGLSCGGGAFAALVLIVYGWLHAIHKSEPPLLLRASMQNRIWSLEDELGFERSGSFWPNYCPVCKVAEVHSTTGYAWCDSCFDGRYPGERRRLEEQRPRALPPKPEVAEELAARAAMLAMGVLSSDEIRKGGKDMGLPKPPTSPSPPPRPTRLAASPTPCRACGGPCVRGQIVCSACNAAAHSRASKKAPPFETTTIKR